MMAAIAFFEMLFLQVAYFVLWGQFVLETKIVGCVPFLAGIYALGFLTRFDLEKAVEHEPEETRQRCLKLTNLGFVSVVVCLSIWMIFRQVTPAWGAEDCVQVIRGIFIVATYLLLLIFAPVTFVLYVRAFLPHLR